MNKKFVHSLVYPLVPPNDSHSDRYRSHKSTGTGEPGATIGRRDGGARCWT